MKRSCCHISACGESCRKKRTKYRMALTLSRYFCWEVMFWALPARPCLFAAFPGVLCGGVGSLVRDSVPRVFGGVGHGLGAYSLSTSLSSPLSQSLSSRWVDMEDERDARVAKAGNMRRSGMGRGRWRVRRGWKTRFLSDSSSCDG